MLSKLIVNRSLLIVHRLVTKFIVFAFLLAITGYLLPIIANAQSSTPSATQPVTYNLPATVSPTSPLYTDLIVSNMFHTFSCLAIGQSLIGQPCLNYQLTKNTQGMIQSTPILSSVNTSGGLLGTTGNLIGALYTNHPLKTTDYLASIGQDLGIVKEVKAQVAGSGAQVLSPILVLWQTSRNIAYVLMIVIFLIIGLMVIFRTKINPQTVITAQAALPGLVLGLILITFSYFLAGLISDTAFIGTNVVGYYFSIAQNPTKPPQNLVDDLSEKNVFSVLSHLTRIMRTDSVTNALSSVWDNLADPTLNNDDIFSLDPQRVLKTFTTIIAAQFALPFGSLFGGAGQAVAGIITATITQSAPVQVAGFALAFVAMAILIYAMLRLALRLINSYLTIIFLTITAPFQFLAAALPGRQSIATEWLQNMLANVLAFPAVLAVLYFVAFLVGKDICTQPACPFIVSQVNQTEYNTIIPTAYAAGAIVGKVTFPLFGGLDLDFVRILLAFGALIAVPAVPDIIVRTIGKLSQAGQLIGQEIGTSTSSGQRYAGQLQQGVQSVPGQVGRLTDEQVYYKSEGGKYEVSPLQSRAGLPGKLRARWQAGAANPTIDKAAVPFWKRFF